MNDQLNASRAARRHIATEYLNDVDALMETVGNEGILFSQGVRTPQGGITFEHQDTKSDVRAFYTKRNASMEILGSHEVLEVASSWHVFIAGVGPLRDTDSDQMVLREFIAILVPQEGTDDLVGECPIRRFEGFRQDTHDPSNPESVMRGRVELAELHNKMLDALSRRDADSIGELFHPEAGLIAQSAPPVDGVCQADGRAAIARYYTNILTCDSFDVTCISRICGEWYVYSEQLWRATRGSQVQSRRVAEYLTINADGSIAARVAYSVPAGDLGQ